MTQFMAVSRGFSLVLNMLR